MNATHEIEADVVVVGSGLAGLVCALSLAPKFVTVITKTTSIAGGSCWLAQGGIAAAIGPGDSPKSHAADTIAAGAGLSDAASVVKLTEESAEGLRWLRELGVPFDEEIDGGLSLAKEAAHSAARVVHAKGDATGKALIDTLVERVLETSSIRVLTDTFADEIINNGSRVTGLNAYNDELGWHKHRAPNIVIATGGIGSLWSDTTNPREATGDGLAMAERAGAELADLEFMQFHPTALAGGGVIKGSLPLLTEALRGAGATLIDEAGIRFMQGEHEAAELAPRDVIARAIFRRVRSGGHVYLDLRPVLESGLGHLFPKALETARQCGVDPETEALPVTPAAHYHMGGVVTDRDGRTTIKGLWACGEVAATGVHGANRLASNSLLEALIYARRAATRIALEDRVEYTSQEARCSNLVEQDNSIEAIESLRSIINSLRLTMSRHVGILRSGAGLQAACAELNKLQILFDTVPRCRSTARTWGECRNLLLIARLVALAALQREESRGAHFRVDYPRPRDHWRRRQAMTARSLSHQSCGIRT